MTELATYSVPIYVPEPEPLPGHLAPLDKRHRWVYRSVDRRGDFWYRCRTCGRRRRVVAIVNLLSRKMRQAEFDMDERLSETLYAR